MSGSVRDSDVFRSVSLSDSGGEGTSLRAGFWRALQSIWQCFNVFRAVEIISKALATQLSRSAKKKPAILKGKHPPLHRDKTTTVQSMGSPDPELTTSQRTDGWEDISPDNCREKIDELGHRVEIYSAEDEKEFRAMLAAAQPLTSESENKDSSGPQSGH